MTQVHLKRKWKYRNMKAPMKMIKIFVVTRELLGHTKQKNSLPLITLIESYQLPSSGLNCSLGITFERLVHILDSLQSFMHHFYTQLRHV